MYKPMKYKLSATFYLLTNKKTNIKYNICMHTYNNIQHTVKETSKYRYLHMLYSLHPLDTPSNVIIDKFDITKNAFLTRFFF